MRVGRNRDLDALALRRVGMDVIQIQPIRLRVDLQVASQVVRGRYDAIHIDVIGLARADQPAGRMAENGDMAVLVCTEYLIQHGRGEQTGYTGGWGHFHIPDDLFLDLRAYRVPFCASYRLSL